MKKELVTYTVAQLCEGFIYSRKEGKGLFGLNGRLTIQPQFQRNYIYADGKKDAEVIKSIVKGYPLGLLYFNKLPDGRLEVLDGQQRITSLGRFVTGDFGVFFDGSQIPKYFVDMEERKDLILNTELLCYECEPESSEELRRWFEVVNMPGVEITPQERRNAYNSGPFVDLAKAEFSNSMNSNIQMWSNYIKGAANRQEILERALDWVSDGHIDEYMLRHRYDDNIEELKNHFNEVIDWIDKIFDSVRTEMRGLEWGRLYKEYKDRPEIYNKTVVNAKIEQLFADEYVTNKKNIYEYVLGGCVNDTLLNIRVFDKTQKTILYNRQTAEAKEKGISNCPDCVLEGKVNKSRIWDIKDMEADHIKAWSKGGATDLENGQMLCIHHNKLKGNR